MEPPNPDLCYDTTVLDEAGYPKKVPCDGPYDLRVNSGVVLEGKFPWK